MCGEVGYTFPRSLKTWGKSPLFQEKESRRDLKRQRAQIKSPFIPKSKILQQFQNHPQLRLGIDIPVTAAGIVAFLQ